MSLVIVIPVVWWGASNYWRTAGGRDKVKPEIVADGFVALPGGAEIAPAHDFASDVHRLDEALNRFRRESAEEVLRRVHDANAARGRSVCSFESKGGQLSLLYGDQPGTGLGASVTQCADAVEQAAEKTGL